MPTECYRLNICGISSGVHLENVLHFNVDNNDDATPLALAQELVDIWRNDPLDDWCGFNSNHYAVRWIEAKRILPGGGNSVWAEFPGGSNPGLINVTQCPISLAPIVKLYAGLTEGIQGRVFLPAPSETHCVNNVLTDTYIGLVVAFNSTNLAFSGAHDWQWAVYSKKNNQAYSVTTAALGPILGQIGRRRVPG